MSEKGLLILSTSAAPLLAALIALLFGGSVYLFLMLKVELRLLVRRAVTRAELEDTQRQWNGELEKLRASLSEMKEAAPRTQLEEALRKVNSEFEELRLRVREGERERRNALAWSEEPESLKLNRRAQILSLHRKGKRVPEIAATLNIPQGEVELMVKVHDLSQSASLEIQPV